MNQHFNMLPPAQIDPILAANAEWPSFQAEHEDAVNVTVGVIIDPSTMKPWRPAPVVRAYEEALHGDIDDLHDYGYQPVVGDPAYLQEAGKFAFGAEQFERHGADMLAFQTVGGTEGLRRAKEMLTVLMRKDTDGNIPMVLDAGYINHSAIFAEPFQLTTYQHKDPKTGEYNHQAALEAMSEAPDHAVMLLQTCGYNDDGADRTPEQWDEVLDVAQQKGAVVLLDSAYLGLACGLPADRYPLVQSVERGLLTIASVSASKNMGVYGERLGALFIANAKAHLGDEEFKNLKATLQNIVRQSFTSPPTLVARAAARALRDPEFPKEVAGAQERLMDNRLAFSSQVGTAAVGIASGRGLFTKLQAEGFNAAQMEALRSEGILALRSSRINIGGMRLDQIERVGAVVAHVMALR